MTRTQEEASFSSSCLCNPRLLGGKAPDNGLSNYSDSIIDFLCRIYYCCHWWTNDSYLSCSWAMLGRKSDWNQIGFKTWTTRKNILPTPSFFPNGPQPFPKFSAAPLPFCSLLSTMGSWREHNGVLKWVALIPHLFSFSLSSDPAEMGVLSLMTATGQGFNFLHKNCFRGGMGAKDVVVVLIMHRWLQKQKQLGGPSPSLRCKCLHSSHPQRIELWRR